ncbi:hypothetical protein [Pseudomonas sp. FME51]|uniref:hypothetical protein n=1 Tax=Pseudomonas sp. FME51 TaxID=2742609 RepID=UPI001865C917|nr:hypothetical protein [Pseudomonas sp. FME51]
MNGLFVSNCDTLESVISVRLAAIWLAWDSIEEQVVYETRDCSKKQDEDWERMMEFKGSGSDASRASVPSPYLYDTIKLPCVWWQQEADKYLEALQVSIEQGHIKPEQIRRSFPDCKLDLDRTFLRREEIEAFLSQFGRGAGEVFYDSIAHLDNRLAEVVRDFYSRVRSPVDLEEAKLKAASMDEDATVDLIAENMQLKEKINKYDRQKVDKDPQKSALIIIARALEVYRKNQGNSNQARYVSDLLDGENSKLLSERTINGLLSEAKKTLADTRKS